MTPNAGASDRIPRIAAGLRPIGPASTGTTGWQGDLGALPRVTGPGGIRPACRRLGIAPCTKA